MQSGQLINTILPDFVVCGTDFATYPKFNGHRLPSPPGCPRAMDVH